MFGLGFREEMVALLVLCSYCGVGVCLLLPPLDVGASVWSYFYGRDGCFTLVVFLLWCRCVSVAAPIVRGS